MFPVSCGKIGRSKHRRAVVGLFVEPLSKILLIPKFNEINNALILALVRFGASPAQGQTDRDLAVPTGSNQHQGRTKCFSSKAQWQN